MTLIHSLAQSGLLAIIAFIFFTITVVGLQYEVSVRIQKIHVQEAKIKTLEEQIHLLQLKVESLRRFHRFYTVGVLELKPEWPAVPGGSEYCNALLIDRSDMCIEAYDWIHCLSYYERN